MAPSRRHRPADVIVRCALLLGVAGSLLLASGLLGGAEPRARDRAPVFPLITTHPQPAVPSDAQRLRRQKALERRAKAAAERQREVRRAELRQARAAQQARRRRRANRRPAARRPAPAPVPNAAPVRPVVSAVPTQAPAPPSPPPAPAPTAVPERDSGTAFDLSG